MYVLIWFGIYIVGNCVEGVNFDVVFWIVVFWSNIERSIFIVIICFNYSDNKFKKN